MPWPPPSSSPPASAPAAVGPRGRKRCTRSRGGRCCFSPAGKLCRGIRPFGGRGGAGDGRGCKRRRCPNPEWLCSRIAAAPRMPRCRLPNCSATARIGGTCTDNPLITPATLRRLLARARSRRCRGWRCWRCGRRVQIATVACSRAMAWSIGSWSSLTRAEAERGGGVCTTPVCCAPTPRACGAGWNAWAMPRASRFYLTRRGGTGPRGRRAPGGRRGGAHEDELRGINSACRTGRGRGHRAGAAARGGAGCRGDDDRAGDCLSLHRYPVFARRHDRPERGVRPGRVGG